MKRPLPLWIAAVVPAALVGHGLAYAISGQSAANAEHAWVAPALECSLAVLAALCCGLVAATLLKAGIMAHTATERSVGELWPRLALAQLAMFCGMETAEGNHVTVVGCLVQLLVALCVAYLLALFSRLLVSCLAGAEQASHYLQRLTQPCAELFVYRQPQCISHALAVRAGTARFQRPPPIG